jgi:hypothetical protein
MVTYGYIDTVSGNAIAIFDDVALNEVGALKRRPFNFLEATAIGDNFTSNLVFAFCELPDIANLPQNLKGFRHVVRYHMESKASVQLEPEEFAFKPANSRFVLPFPGYLAVDIDVVANIKRKLILDELLGLTEGC